MVLAAYGAGVDLHCGGADLRFPHHACEALIAERATGVGPFARAWLRAGTVHFGGLKMAKSTGNLILVDDLLADHSPAAVRLLCINRGWSQPWNYTPDLLEQAEVRLTELYAGAARPGPDSGIDAVNGALLDNLDIPAAVAIALDAGGPAARYLAEVLQLN